MKVIEHVGTHSKNTKVKRVLLSISNDLAQGETLAHATMKQSEFLSPFFANLLASGELSGNLDVMLNDLADYYEDKLAQGRKIKSQLAYPMILLIMCWFLGTFSIGIISVIMDGFNGGGGVGGLKEYFGKYAQFQINAMIVFAALFGIAITLSRMGILRWITCYVTTFLWPLSTVTRKLGMARFFRSLSLMITSGLGIIPCITKSAQVTDNPYIEKDLMKSIPHIKNGQTLVESFRDSTLMTPLAFEMLAVGEQSGKLDEQLRKAAQYHQDEADHAIKQATTILTTLIMLGVFILIGAIVIYFWSNFYGGLMDGLGI
jgi:type IV pilus assembly protein PilC